MAKDQSRWLAGVLPQHDDVAQVRRIGRSLVEVQRKRMSSVVVGIISANPVTLADLEPLVDGIPRPAMIVNIPTRATWSGLAIEQLEHKGIAFGKMYDLYRALRDNNVSAYKYPEFFYVERIIDQHRNVVHRSRRSDRVYQIYRHSGPDLVVALTQAYEVTANDVRTAYADHSPFNVLLKTNPYGGISTQGYQAAQKLGIQIVNEDGLDQIL